jgi:hypothetical protein
VPKKMFLGEFLLLWRVELVDILSMAEGSASNQQTEYYHGTMDWCDSGCMWFYLWWNS